MPKPLPIGIIQMYTDMINEAFSPLQSALEGISAHMAAQIRTEVKKDWRIYALYAKKAALKAQISEIRDALKTYEDKTWTREHGYINKIDAEVQRRIAMVNEPMQLIKNTKAELVNRVKLAGVTEDVKQVFSELPKTIESLKDIITTLPLQANELTKAISEKTSCANE
jgi:chaperonin cofactor prefoldin